MGFLVLMNERATNVYDCYGSTSFAHARNKPGANGCTTMSISHESASQGRFESRAMVTMFGSMDTKRHSGYGISKRHRRYNHLVMIMNHETEIYSDEHNCMSR